MVERGLIALLAPACPTVTATPLDVACLWGTHTPKHVVFEGDAGTLVFADAYNVANRRALTRV